MSNLAILCGYHPQFPASSPYVTSIGGTQGPESGSPEISCQSQLGGVITSGGGFSYDFPTPYWQTDAVSYYLGNAPEAFAGFNRNGRGYPDLSAMAVNYMTVVGALLEPVSGTSASTPVIAGMVSLVNSQRIRIGKGPVGWLNPALYALSSNVSTSFTNDITSGINNCVAHATICCAEGFEAIEKWDPNTGLGSLDYAKFETQFVGLGNISAIYSAAPTLVPVTTPVPTASPTLQAGWAYINVYNSASCSDIIVTVKGVPTEKCLPHYINDVLVGSVQYTCQNNGLMAAVNTYYDDNCSTLFISEDFSSGCASVYEEYTSSYISQELICDINNPNQTLPLGQLTGSATTPVWAVEKMFDTQLSSGSCSDDSFCGFMAYKNNYCIGFDTSSTTASSYYFQWPYINEYKTNGFCEGFSTTGNKNYLYINIYFPF
jgi:subtilase family serine protease